MDSAQAQTSGLPVGGEVRTIRNELSTQVAKEKAAIVHEVSMLHRALDEAHQLVSHLEQKASPVSVPQDQTPPDSPSHEAVGVSPVYGSLHDAVSGIHSLQSRLARIIQSLEV